MTLAIQGPVFGQGAVCEAILCALPQWFGIESAVVQYGRDIETLPTWIAEAEGRPVGFLSLKQHNKYAAELYVLGVRSEYHRQGIGRDLVKRAEEYLCQCGVEYVQVKTLGPSNPDTHYAQTRAFYLALGFRPLEEFRTIWNEQNPCLVMVKCLVARASSASPR